MNRRTVLSIAGRAAAGTAAAITPSGIASAADKRKSKGNDVQAANDVGIRGMFVPITLGVPDSVPAGESLMLMIVPQTNFSANQSQAYYISAAAQDDSDSDDLLGTGGGPLQRTWNGADGPQPIFYDITIAPGGITNPVVFTLYVADNPQFAYALETAEIVVY